MNGTGTGTAMGNTALQAVLAEVGWSPEQFARRIAEHGRQQGMAVPVHATTPYHWLRDARRPQDPVPQLAAGLLSERLGRRVGLADLGWASQRGVRHWLSSRPDTIVLQPTSLCPLACTYCYLPERHLNQRMSPAVATAVAAGIEPDWSPVEGRVAWRRAARGWAGLACWPPGAV